MIADFKKRCWKCDESKTREFFTESRWNSDSDTSLCARCACDIEVSRYENDLSYRENKKKKAKDSYDKEEARLKKKAYRDKVKKNGGKKLKD